MLDPRSRASGRAPLEDSVLEVATVLRALGEGVEELKAHYLSLPSPPKLPTTDRSTANRLSATRSTGPSPRPNTDVVAGQFPRWRSFKSQEGKECKIEYIRRLPQDLDKGVFLAKMTSDGSDEKNVVVKFSHSYSPTTHETLADAQLAPQLYYAKFEDSKLGSDGPGMWVVVMEYLENVADLPKIPNKGQAVNLKKLLEVLRKAESVHGDLRRPNILTRGDELFIVDFDWAGKDGVAKYPFHINLNEDKNWHVDVGSGRPIKMDHDDHRVQMMLAGRV